MTPRATKPRAAFPPDPADPGKVADTSATPRTSATSLTSQVAAVAEQLDRQLYRVADVMRVLSMSRTVIFELLRSGRLRSVKQGRTRLIPASALREYVALLERESGAA